MDEKIGQVLSLIDRHGLKEDTIIVFQSDHGHSTEVRTFGGGSAGPYRGAKFSLFEGGIRVPAIIRWPGKLPGNAVRDQLATSIDWFPTIADLCGIPLPLKPIDGKSLKPILISDEAGDAHAQFHWQSGGVASNLSGPCAKGRGNSSATLLTRVMQLTQNWMKVDF